MQKNVVITGATKGIGRALVDQFAAEGFDLALNARNAEDLAALEQEIKGLYPQLKVITRPTDMSVKAEVLAFAELVMSQWDSLEVLINNAGVFLPGKISEEEEGVLEKQINTNLYSAYHLTRALLPIMKPQQRGHIFNMCSIASFMAYPGGGSYSISKFALLGFSKVLRAELKEVGIKVTSVMPGATWSASWAGVELPEDRLMQASDVAKTIWAAYTLSDSAVMEDVVLRPQLGDL